MKKLMTLLGGALLVTMAAGWQGTRLAVPFWIPPQPPKAVLSALVPVTPPVSPVVPVATGPVTMRVTPSRTHVTAAGDLYVHIAVRAPGEVSKDHVPTDWILVLDRSGSMMARGKMKHAKAAVRALAQGLHAEDRVALVGFDHVANILHPLARLENKESFDASVEGLFPRGSTNLLEGLELGLTAVDRTATDRARRILFMTDGIDSFGEQNAHRMREIARQAGLEGISITTMGMGAEFQENLLVQIAEASGGRYVYLGDPAQMATLYQEELAHGGAVVATDLKLTLTYDASARGSTLLGSVGEPMFPRGQVVLGSLAAGETRNLVVKIAHTGVAAPILSLQLEGRAARGGEKVQIVQTLEIQRAADAAEADASVNPLVLALAEKFEVSHRVETALDMVASGRKQEAQQILEDQIQGLRASGAKGPDVEQDRQKVEQVLKEVRSLAATDSDAVGAFVKQQKWNTYQWRR